MEIELIGAIAIAAGTIGWIAGPSFAITVFFVSTLLSSAGAIVLPSLGFANIQPAHLLLGFLAIAAVARRGAVHRAGDTLSFPDEGFWLALTAAYAVLSAFFLPRIFAGSTYVYAIARTELGLGIVAQPLAPTTGNITQSLYFIGDLACFLVVYVYASRPRGLVAIVDAALACAAANLAFAAVDLGAYWSGLGDLLGFIRNASYSMLNDTAVLGFKRIVGSFPEASTFAYFTAGLFAFCTVLWLGGVRKLLSGTLALLSLAALAFSTSSTGYAATGGFLALLFLSSLTRALWRPVTRGTLVLVTVLPIFAVAGLSALRLDEPAWGVVTDMVDRSILNKMNSRSGIERSKWNDQAMVNFADTSGLGGGDGSVRASSFPIAVLGNIGVPGAATYGIFLLQLFLARRRRWTAPFPVTCQSAARWACLTQLIGASVAGSFIDLALPFFIFAGLACAGPELAPVRRAPPAARLAAAE